MLRACKTIAIASLAAGLSAATAYSAEPGAIVEYAAEYEVRYKGRRVARANFNVTADGGGNFVFNSSTRARGILRLASPRPAVEWSQFRLTEDQIVPLNFRYEDGSRSGEDNYSLEFDSAAGEVRVTGPAGRSSVPFETGLLDRGSLQVALMRDLGACRHPGPLRYVDDDGVSEYRYERLDDLAVETGIGTLDTIRFSQRREGSSRTTILWLAPELAYLPVRIEQIRDTEIETVFSLEVLSGLERSESACSSFG
jgi:hypothetical protein